MSFDFCFSCTPCIPRLFGLPLLTLGPDTLDARLAELLIQKVTAYAFGRRSILYHAVLSAQALRIWKHKIDIVNRNSFYSAVKEIQQHKSHTFQSFTLSSAALFANAISVRTNIHLIKLTYFNKHKFVLKWSLNYERTKRTNLSNQEKSHKRKLRNEASPCVIYGGCGEEIITLTLLLNLKT